MLNLTTCNICNHNHKEKKKSLGSRELACEFNWLIQYSRRLHTRIETPSSASEGLQIQSYVRRLKPLNFNGSLSWHTKYNTCCIFFNFGHLFGDLRGSICDIHNLLSSACRWNWQHMCNDLCRRTPKLLHVEIVFSTNQSKENLNLRNTCTHTLLFIACI